MSLLTEIKEAVEKGRAKKVEELCKVALDEGISADQIIDESLLAAMTEMAEKFKRDEVYMPEIMVASRAMKAGMGIVKPGGADGEQKGTIVIGTVLNDLHDIGKNIVAMMLEGNGYKIIDLGINVPVEKFVEAVKEHKPDIVAISALLTTTMQDMKNTVDGLAEYRDTFKILVGGAPITQAFADEIGADGFAPDAARAVDKANELFEALKTA